MKKAQMKIKAARAAGGDRLPSGVRRRQPSGHRRSDDHGTTVNRPSKKTEMEELNLERVPVFVRDRTKECFAAGNVAGMLITMPNTECLEFVARNAEALKRRGIYEPALAGAFSDTRTNFATYPPSLIKFAFHMADRKKLLAAGDPLPPGKTFKVYRGVAGLKRWRRHIGPSWTGDVEKARWFARRSALAGLPNPAVLVATIRREDVYYYTNHRNEHEFVAYVDSPKRLNIDLGDLRREAEEEAAAEAAAAKAAKAAEA